MACKQIFTARLNNPSATAARYLGPTFAKYEWGSTLVGAPWRVAGSFKNLYVEFLSAAGTGKSFTFTLVKNGSDTGLTVTVADPATSASNTSTVVTVAPGDLLYWKCVPSIGTPTLSNQRVSVEFNGTTDNESGYASLIDLNTSQTWRGSVFSAGQWNTSNINVGAFEVVGAAGNLTELYYNLAAAPASTDSYEFALYINGTKQDGSGGTTDTRVTITGSATTGSWTGSIALSPGDLVILQVIPTGGPVTTTAGYASKFVATTDGESQYCATVFTNLPTSGGPYYAKSHWHSTGWTATEADHTSKSGSLLSVVLKNMRIRLGSAVAIGPINFKLRLNGADAGPSVTMVATNQTGSDTSNTATLNLNDTVDFSYTPTASPGGATVAGIGMVMYGLSVSPPLSNIFMAGSNTTVKATDSIALSVDGNTNVLTEANKCQIYGKFGVTQYVGMLPIAEPTLPSGEAGIFIDVADGDLKIKFANGTVATIATN